jgi:hypothetical protein
MNKLLLALALCISLSSCHKDEKRKRHHSVMTNKKSLVNSWFGKDHYNRSPKIEDESMNKASPNESVEIDAGKMQMQQPPQNNTPPSDSTSLLDQTDNNSTEIEMDSQLESDSIVSDSMETELNDVQSIQDEVTYNASETVVSDSKELELNEVQPEQDEAASLKLEAQADVT